MSQCWQLYFTAINKVSLATTYADLIHRVSSTKGKQVHADRNGYMTGQSLPLRWAQGNKVMQRSSKPNGYSLAHGDIYNEIFGYLHQLGMCAL